MTLHILSQQNTVLNKFIAEIRDKRIQRDSMRFRRNMERIGEIMAYEISKEFTYRPQIVTTPLGEASVETIGNEIVLATILRAGLPYHQGFLNYFDDAQNAFVSAYRKSKKDGTFTVKVEYISCGSLEGKTMLLVDPMLATGGTLVAATHYLAERGAKDITAVCILGAPEGLKFVEENLDPSIKFKLVLCAVDEKLNDKCYIVPGLGDAGDRLYGVID